MNRSTVNAVLKTCAVCILVLAGTTVPATAVDIENATPDWNGVWRAIDARPLLEPADGSPIPFKPKARVLYEKNLERRKQNDAAFDLTARRCASPGVPRILFLPYAFEILTPPGQMIFVYEFNHLYRQVFLAPPTPRALYPTAMGLATGHWEGTQLTIETSTRSGDTLLDDAIPNSEALKVIEHLERRGDLLEDRVTVDDPAVFEKPWTAVIHYQYLRNYHISEDVCLDRRAKGRPAIGWPLKANEPIATKTSAAK
jgi:hypothetical protein